jgi:hypothetical protein
LTYIDYSTHDIIEEHGAYIDPPDITFIVGILEYVHDGKLPHSITFIYPDFLWMFVMLINHIMYQARQIVLYGYAIRDCVDPMIIYFLWINNSL